MVCRVRAYAQEGGDPRGPGIYDGIDWWQIGAVASETANTLTAMIPIVGPLIALQNGGKRVKKKAGISTGRTSPNDLKEKLAMDEVKSKPSGYTPPRMPKMNDKKNGLYAEDGWVKRTQNTNGVEIHYVENTKTGEFIDFKFKD